MVTAMKAFILTFSLFKSLTFSRSLGFNLFQYLLDGLSYHGDNGPFVRLFFEKRSQNILDRSPDGLVSDFIGQFENFIKNLFVVLPWVEGSTVQNLVADYSQRPNVDCIGIIMKFSLFRGNILFCACDCLHDYLLSTETEICQFYQR